jgi:phage shock protein A
MGIASRLIRLCKADLHGVMDQIEDQELLLKQYLREMEEALAAKKTHLERLQARRAQNGRDLAGCRDKVGAIEEDIALAVAREKDDIARMLIRRKYPLRQSVEGLETAQQHLQAEIDAAQEAYTQQTAAHERLRRQAAAFDGGRRADSESAPGRRHPGAAHDAPSDAEIELELLQCKEALKAGRSS